LVVLNGCWQGDICARAAARGSSQSSPGFPSWGSCSGVATLIIVMAVMNGFRNELLSKILGMSGHITIQATESVFDDYDRTAGEIRGVPGVRMAMPFVDGQAMASSSQRNLGVVVRGVQIDALEQLGDLASKLKQGISTSLQTARDW
jgi:lipoprotein-releasing system permease protein